jgi:hypothetical protein
MTPECILKKSSYYWHSGIFVAINIDLNPRLASGPGPEICLHIGEVIQIKKSISPQKSREFMRVSNLLCLLYLIKF